MQSIDPIVINDVTILNKDNRFQSLATITSVKDKYKSDAEIIISDEQITVNLNEAADEIVIYNMSGKKLMDVSSKSNHYNINNDFKTGNYLMMIKGEKVSIETFQIVK